MPFLVVAAAIAALSAVTAVRSADSAAASESKTWASHCQT